MKKSIWAGLVLLLFVSISFASDYAAAEKAQAAIFAYSRSLQSPVAGIRLNAMYQVAKLKSQYPELDYQVILNKLGKISKSDALETLRLHAKLTSMYLNDEALWKTVRAVNDENPMEFFNELYRKINAAYIPTGI